MEPASIGDPRRRRELRNAGQLRGLAKPIERDWIITLAIIII
jgi:hypothetical protein